MIIGPRAIITDDITAGGYGSAWGSKASSDDHAKVSNLINRGWVPATLRDPAARPAGQPPPFTPGPKSITNAGKNQQPHQQYFCREVDRMSQAMNTLPLFIDAFYESSVKGGPIGGQTKVLLRNNHLEYIITWFSLGTFSLAMWVYWLFF
uniref:SURF1-like protein n=1 Tax=Mesocestoides corti TaxID=53468 RepID=A0A5K3FBY1_MESCO